MSLESEDSRLNLRQKKQLPTDSAFFYFLLIALEYFMPCRNAKNLYTFSPAYKKIIGVGVDFLSHFVCVG